MTRVVNMDQYEAEVLSEVREFQELTAEKLGVEW